MRVIIATSALAIAGIAGLAACSTDEGDFQSETEKFIEGKMSDEVEEQMGQREEWEDAECEEPENTDKDTTYNCTATDSQGNEWTFESTIDGDNSFKITAANPSDAPATDGSTPAAGSTPDDQSTATTGG